MQYKHSFAMAFYTGILVRRLNGLVASNRKLVLMRSSIDFYFSLILKEGLPFKEKVSKNDPLFILTVLFQA